MAIALAVGVARADDWAGAVKVLASYDNPDPTLAEVNVTVDVVYDTPGSKGLAWGTMSYQRRAQAGVPQLELYYHALCVGRWNSGNNYSVAGVLVKAVGTGPATNYMTFEFDVGGKKWRTFGSAGATEADARATCDKQSGLFPGTFNHGYVIAK